MPSPEQIKERVANLESHSWALELSDSFEAIIKPEQRWVGKQYGASFELTRTEGLELCFRGFTPNIVTEALDLILKGKRKGKQRLLEEFISVLGEPLELSPAVRHPRLICATWDAIEITQTLTPEQASS